MAPVGTFIVRVFRDKDGTGTGLQGTVERPGSESKAFHTGEELIALLSDDDQARSGNEDGSTPSSAIRET